ncbi:MAG: DUF1223 domain-containing protein [Pseudomonadota bacterium]
MQTILRGLTLLTALATASVNSAEPVRLDSGERTAALVELFTSEGCHSCPPADEWLSDLKADPRLWKTVIPVAFHVDYWDYIGWPDRFAVPANTDRQRNHRVLGNVYSVYTPGFVVDGREWRGWFRRPVLSDSGRSAPGRLQAAIDGERIEAVFDPHRKLPAPLELHMAILGMGLSTDVEAGENAGKRLDHDFVVLRQYRWALREEADGKQSMASDFRLPRSNAQSLAVAVWVSSPGTQMPLQAVGGPLPTR